MSVLRSILTEVTKDITSSILSPSQRFLTTLVVSGSMSYIFAATLVSGTVITLTVYPTNGTQGLPPGAPSVTDNKWQTITYTTTGNVDNLGFDGTNFFAGIVWDYSAPSINVALALKENFALTTTAKNSLDPSGATDATAVNISESDLFTLQSNGDYLGVDRVTNGNFVTDTDWTKGAGTTISGGKANFSVGLVNALFQNIGIEAGEVLRVTAQVDASINRVEVHIGGDATASDFRGSGNQVWDVPAAITPNGNLIFNGESPGFTGTLDDVTARQLLEKAQ